MKQIMKITSSLLLIAMLLFCAVSCAEKVDTNELWESATYSSDTVIGEGANTVNVEITAGDKTVKLTIKTDKATLGEALFEHGLVNDASFFNVCNGITADWDKEQAYWSFYVGNETAVANYGINDEKSVTSGEPVYRLVYTK